MTDTTIGIFGIGRLGEAVSTAILSIPNQKSLFVSRRNVERVARLVQYDPRVQPCDPEEIMRACDYIIITLCPDDARELLLSLKFEARHQVVSVMAEIGLAELRELTKGAGSICRILVLPSVTKGGQLLPVYPSTDAAEKIFGNANELMPVESEIELMTFWSITSLLSSVMTIGDVASQWLELSGIDRLKATAYTRTLYSDVHSSSASGFCEGLDHASTPGGLNVMMREKLLRLGVEDEISNGLDEIQQRLLKNMSRVKADPD